MSERSKEHASKACEGETLREFESRFIRRRISFKLHFALEAFLFCRAFSGWKSGGLRSKSFIALLQVLGNRQKSVSISRRGLSEKSDYCGK